MLMGGVAKRLLCEVVSYCAGSNGIESSVRYTKINSGVSAFE